MSSEADASKADRPRAFSARVRLAGSTIARVGGLLIAVIIIMTLFAAASDGRFLSFNNLLGLLRYMSTVAIVGLGLTLVIVVGEIDLSFASVYGFSAMVVAVSWILWGVPIYVAIPLGLLAAVLVGAFNGFFTTIVGIPSFIATLGSSTLVFGFTILISNTASFNPTYPPTGREIDPSQLDFFTGLSNQSLPLGFPMQALWMLGAAMIFAFLLGRSVFGFRLKAIGGNPQAARLARLPVRRYKIVAFVLCSTMAALAAILDFAFIGSTQVNAGQSLLFPVFAAVIIGGASLAGGRGTVVGTLGGALLLAVLANGLALISAGAFAQQMLLGTVTIAAVVLDRFTQKLR
ncbi:MAG: ABC transporter permease [Chloroflexi bacterium]|jgi:ribose/xylose/arabinose/galactoside ABC-type transport system permease subunit|nr:ABC transporter permease [Chloroflexota bacterium]